MSKIIKLGMVFNTATAPDFGSIALTRNNDLTALAEDIPKLNSTLTRAVCEPLLEAGTFTIVSGDVCFITDWKTAQSAKVYMYEGSSDAWYEVVENE